MSEPLQITPETFTGFILDPLVDELLGSAEVEREGKTARILVEGRPLTVVLTVMRAGATLHEHKRPARCWSSRSAAKSASSTTRPARR